MMLNSSVAAVITGAGSGLGRATAKILSDLEVRVSLFDIDQARLVEAACELKAAHYVVDVTNSDSVQAAFAHARSVNGQERILVNCAGIVKASRTASRSRKDSSIKSFPLDAFQRVVDVNLIGTFRCLAFSAAGMLTLPAGSSGERGVIINTASIAAEDGQIGQVAYAASKAGVMGITLPAARDLANEGIRVNAIMPGMFATNMLGAMSPEAISTLENSIPFPKRLGEPMEFASLVVEMCRNIYINGTNVRLDGAARLPPS